MDDLARQAIKRGDVDGLERELGETPSLHRLNGKPSNGVSLLFFAIEEGRADTVALLLAKKNIEVNLGSNYQTPLFLAAQKGYANIVAKLLDHKEIQVNYGGTGKPPLSIAAENGHKEVLELLLGHEKIEVNLDRSLHDTGYQASQWAFSSGYQTPFIGFSSGHQRSYWTSDRDYQTPLFLAAKEGHADIVAKLLAHEDIQVNFGGTGKTPLSIAAENGHKDVVTLLLRHKKIEVNLDKTRHESGYQTPLTAFDGGFQKPFSTSISDHQTPLFLAAEKGHAHIVALLLAHNDIQVNLSSIDRTPISVAAENGHKDIVALLLDHEDIEVNLKNTHDGTSSQTPLSTPGGNYRTPLVLAAEKGHADIVELLLTYKDIQVNLSSNGRTPLSVAAENGHKNIVESLISKNDINLNSTDKSGWTPLSWAIAKGQMDIIKLLIMKTNVGLNAKNSDGQTPFTEAASRGHGCVIELLVLKEDIDLNLEFVKDNSLLTGDIKQRKIAMIMPFFTKDDLDRISRGGHNRSMVVASIMKLKDLDIPERLLAMHEEFQPNRTPLSWAAENGYVALIRFLLVRKRTNPNIRDQDGRTPLSRASENGHEFIAKLLLGRNATDISKNEIKWEPEEEKELLLARVGADPNVNDNDGQTPLSWAIANGHEAIVKLLVPIDTTTLFLLAQGGKRTAVKQLIFAESNLDERNGHGQTPLHAAILSGHLEIAKDLISYGAGINFQDYDNMTPLRLAMRKKDNRLIQELLKHKADIKDIMANEWRYAYKRQSTDIVLLSETASGERRADFTTVLPTADQLSQVPLGMNRYLYSFSEGSDHLSWSKVPITDSKEGLNRDILHTNIHKGVDDSFSDISIFSRLSFDNYLPSSPSSPSATKIYRIAWRLKQSTKPGGQWTPTVYFSTLPSGWMPENEFEIFKQFIFHIKENWLNLFQQLEIHLSDRRLEQLKCKGKDPDMISHLAEDAQNLAKLRSILHDQVRTADKFVKDYCRVYNNNRIPKGLLGILTDEFEQVLTEWMGKLDQVIRDLLQIEFAWASINETRISTKLGQNVMLLTYVSIFYLPLGFCAALWAVPDITNSSTRNPFIITSVTIGLVTLLVTFNMGRISGVAQRLLKYGKDMKETNMPGENGHNRGQERTDGRKCGKKSRFGDLLTALKMASTKKGEQSKQNESQIDSHNAC